jgi:hypothetical protein
MERIVRILFATTFVSIFCYLIIYYFAVTSGNGGEYWGFDGYTDAPEAAARSFDAGDYRLLGYAFESELGQKTREVPYAERCFNQPSSPAHTYRMNTLAAKAGYRSIDKARNYAIRYNRAMVFLLEETEKVSCDEEEPTNVPPNKSMQTDQNELSRLLHAQEPRQLALAADLGRWADEH